MGGSWIGFTALAALAVAIVALCLTLSHSANEKEHPAPRGFDPQCYKPYETLTDAWRATSHGGLGPEGKVMGDVELSICFSDEWAQTGVGGNKWYRFAGAGGDALPLTSPGEDHCGTSVPGWLSDWDGAQPCTKDDECTGECGRRDVCVPTPEHPAPPGHYPEATEGVVEKTACYDYGEFPDGRWTCGEPNQIGVVMCDGFLLWRLPYAPDCISAYCTAASGL